MSSPRNWETDVKYSNWPARKGRAVVNVTESSEVGRDRLRLPG